MNSRDIARRLNFHGDADLSSPGHDALTLWAKAHVKELFDAAQIWPALHKLVLEVVDEWNANIPRKIKVYESAKRHFDKCMDTWIKETERYNCRKKEGHLYGGECAPVEPTFTEIKPTLWKREHWVDKWISWSIPKLEVKTQGGWIDVLIRGSVFPHTAEEGGFWYGERFVTAEERSHRLCGWECLVEVKTNIPSFGELIRQLREYKNGLWGLHQSPKLGLVCVLSPDDRFAQAIRDEGFYFAKMDIPR